VQQLSTPTTHKHKIKKIKKKTIAAVVVIAQVWDKKPRFETRRPDLGQEDQIWKQRILGL